MFLLTLRSLSSPLLFMFFHSLLIFFACIDLRRRPDCPWGNSCLSPNRYPFSCLAVAVIFCSLFISFIKSPSSINCVDMQRTRHDSGPASSRLWCLVKKLCAGFKDETFTICFKRKRTALRHTPHWPGCQCMSRFNCFNVSLNKYVVKNIFRYR